MANIVITGANRGLGLEFVKQMSKFKKNPNIFALCRDPKKAQHLQAVANDSSNITILQADMTDFVSYKNIVSVIEGKMQGGGVNLLINNAGIMIKDTLSSVKYESLRSSFEINAVAPLLFTKSLLPLLKKANPTSFPVNAGNSAVVNISAQLGSIEENTTGGYTSYRLSKAALNMVTKSLAVELKSSKIFVMAFHPGWVKTDMGGANAPLTPEASINGMLTVFSKADETYNGCLFNDKGRKIPW